MILKFSGKAQTIDATLLYPSRYLRLPQVREENSNRILKVLEVGNKVGDVGTANSLHLS
jgi:hypothetical protein